MIKKNLAAVLYKQKHDLSILNILIPKVPKGYALVKMKYSGICHTQLNEISGILGKDKFFNGVISSNKLFCNVSRDNILDAVGKNLVQDLSSLIFCFSLNLSFINSKFFFII